MVRKCCWSGDGFLWVFAIVIQIPWCSLNLLRFSILCRVGYEDIPEVSSVGKIGYDNLWGFAVFRDLWGFKLFSAQLALFTFMAMAVFAIIVISFLRQCNFRSVTKQEYDFTSCLKIRLPTWLGQYGFSCFHDCSLKFIIVVGLCILNFLILIMFFVMFFILVKVLIKEWSCWRYFRFKRVSWV